MLQSQIHKNLVGCIRSVCYDTCLFLSFNNIITSNQLILYTMTKYYNIAKSRPIIWHKLYKMEDEGSFLIKYKIYAQYCYCFFILKIVCDNFVCLFNPKTDNHQNINYKDVSIVEKSMIMYWIINIDTTAINLNCNKKWIPLEIWHHIV